jgi:hypothetical protein
MINALPHCTLLMAFELSTDIQILKAGISAQTIAFHLSMHMVSIGVNIITNIQ